MDFMDRLSLIAKTSNKSLYINIYEYKIFQNLQLSKSQESIIKDTQIIIV